MILFNSCTNKVILISILFSRVLLVHYVPNLSCKCVKCEEYNAKQRRDIRCTQGMTSINVYTLTLIKKTFDIYLCDVVCIYVYRDHLIAHSQERCLPIIILEIVLVVDIIHI